MWFAPRPAVLRKPERIYPNRKGKGEPSTPAGTAGTARLKRPGLSRDRVGDKQKSLGVLMGVHFATALAVERLLRRRVVVGYGLLRLRH